jgi:hypothetical protein
MTEAYGDVRSAAPWSFTFHHSNNSWNDIMFSKASQAFVKARRGEPLSAKRKGVGLRRSRSLFACLMFQTL